MEAVKRTKEVGEAMSAKDWARATALRGSSFSKNIRIYHALGANKPDVPLVKNIAIKVGIVNIGAPAGGKVYNV